MIRVRLFLLIFAICFAAESSPLVERTKREVVGEMIQCHSGDNFNEAENVTGGKCGYSFDYLKDCGKAELTPYNTVKNQELLNLKITKVDEKKYRSVKCQCEGANCNRKEEFTECLTNAFKNGSINKNNLAATELNGIIGCAMNNTNLTFQGFLDSFTTTTTTTPSTTTSKPSNAADDADLSRKDIVITAVAAVLFLVIFGGIIVYCCIKHFSKKSETKSKDLEQGEKKKQKSVKSKDIVTTPTNVSTVSPADATVTPVKTTVSQKTSEDGKVPDVEKPKRESKVESAIKSNPGSIIKSNVKSLDQSSISTDSDAPRDITGLLATVFQVIKKGIPNVYDELVKERKRIYDTMYKGIEWNAVDQEKPNRVVGNRKCLVNNKLRHPIVKECKKAQKGREIEQINAHYVDKERSVIVSESPSHQNMCDFLHLLYLYDISAAISIVSFTDMDDGCGYVPEEKFKTFGCFTVRKIKSQQITGLISVNEIEIYLNGTNPRKFVSIQLMKMGNDKPETYDNAARVLDYIQRHISSKIYYKSPILFHCAEGSDNSSSMAMLHMTITACSSQKQAVNYIAILEDILCARKEAINTRASLVFIFRVFIDYARHLGAIKAYELGTWRRDVENLMKKVLEEDKNDKSSSQKKIPAVTQ